MMFGVNGYICNHASPIFSAQIVLFLASADHCRLQVGAAAESLINPEWLSNQLSYYHEPHINGSLFTHLIRVILVIIHHVNPRDEL